MIRTVSLHQALLLSMVENHPLERRNRVPPGRAPTKVGNHHMLYTLHVGVRVKIQVDDVPLRKRALNHQESCLCLQPMHITHSHSLLGPV